MPAGATTFSASLEVVGVWAFGGGLESSIWESLPRFAGGENHRDLRSARTRVRDENFTRRSGLADHLNRWVVSDLPPGSWAAYGADHTGSHSITLLIQFWLIAQIWGFISHRSTIYSGRPSGSEYSLFLRNWPLTGETSPLGWITWEKVELAPMEDHGTT